LFRIFSRRTFSSSNFFDQISMLLPGLVEISCEGTTSLPSWDMMMVVLDNALEFFLELFETDHWCNSVQALLRQQRTLVLFIMFSLTANHCCKVSRRSSLLLYWSMFEDCRYFSSSARRCLSVVGQNLTKFLCVGSLERLVSSRCYRRFCPRVGPIARALPGSPECPSSFLARKTAFSSYSSRF
jgi:hypothetical protein